MAQAGSSNQRGPPLRQPRRRRGDGGNLGAYEAVMILALLLLSVAIAASLQPAPPSLPNEGAAAVIKADLASLLHAMKGMEDRDYGTKLQRFVVECSNGKTSNFRSFMRSALSPVIDFRLAVQQPEGLLVLCPSEGPPGHEVTSASLIIWGWNQDTAFVVPEYLNLDGADMAMDVTVIPLTRGYPEEAIRDLELEVEVELEGVVYRQAHRLLLRPGAHVTAGVVDGSDVVAYYERTDSKQFTLRLTENGGEPIPAGSPLSVRVPRSWANVTVPPPATGWDNPTVTEDGEWWTISASLQNELNSDSIDLIFNGTRPKVPDEGASVFHTLKVTLGEETYDTSTSLLFRGMEESASLAGAHRRGAVLDLPSRAAPGSAATWRPVVVNPDPDDSVYDQSTQQCILNCRTLTRVTIREPDGLPLFDAASGSGWALDVDGATLNWIGNIEMGSDEVLELPVTVSLSAKEGGQRYHAWRKVQFPASGATLDLEGLGFSGAHHGRVTPQGSQLPGYPASPPSGSAMEVCSHIQVDRRFHHGCATYHIRKTSTFLSARESIARGAEASTLTILNATSYVPGDWITVQANFTAMDEALAPWPPYYDTAETRITVYHPWTPRNTTLTNATAWKRATDASADLRFAFQVPEPVVYGTYVVLAERRFNLTANVQAGEFEFTDENTDQSVRKVAWVTIGEDPVLTPKYFHGIALQGWMRGT